ncbi:hypothetical protein D3C87_1956680 [compost metagenome]
MVGGDTDDRVEQSGLAGAVAAEQCQRAAFLQRKIDLGEDMGFAITGDKAFDPQQFGHQASSPR